MSEPDTNEIYQRQRESLVGAMQSITQAAAYTDRLLTDEENRKLDELIDVTNLLDRAAVRLGIVKFNEDIAQTLARTANGHFFTDDDLREFDARIDAATKRVEAAREMERIASCPPDASAVAYESESAVMCEAMVRRAQQLSSTKEKVRNKGSSKRFDDDFLDALQVFERVGLPYADELRRTLLALKAQGFAISNDAHNASAFEHACVSLWLSTQIRDDEEFRDWLRRDRKDHLRRGDRAKLEDFAARLAPDAKPRTLSRIVREDIRLIRAHYDCKYS